VEIEEVDFNEVFFRTLFNFMELIIGFKALPSY